MERSEIYSQKGLVITQSTKIRLQIHFKGDKRKTKQKKLLSFKGNLRNNRKGSKSLYRIVAIQT